MFYSLTFLARKGPLSLVWIAAHLQHRLKKSHYISIDIPSTVAHIIDPGVPIALRMSAHLLLGVARIYSKKVDYLLQDCNAARTAFYKVSVYESNHILPKDARNAPVHSITLPSTFDLDEMDIDNETDIDWDKDDHRKSHEDITLADRNPTVLDDYVTIRFDEDFSSVNTQPAINSEAITQQEDIHHHSLNTQPPQFSGEIPIQENIPHHSPSTNSVGVHDGGLQSMLEDSGTTNHTGGDRVQIPRRRRRMQQYYDDPVVLSNRVMKKNLEDTRSILRKRSHCLAYDPWTLRNKRFKQHGFDIPLFIGICQELENIQKREYICSKPHLLISEGIDHEGIDHEDTSTATDPNPVGEGTSPVKGGVAAPNVDFDETHDAASPGAYHDNGQDYHDNGQDYGIPDSNPSNAEKDEFSFLEEDNTPASSQRNSTAALSRRARGLVEYLRSIFTEEYSLNSILEGKTRKVAARMFYELLVLRTARVIDVQQMDDGDIRFKLNNGCILT